jgi:hypothetical protein
MNAKRLFICCALLAGLLASCSAAATPAASALPTQLAMATEAPAPAGIAGDVPPIIPQQHSPLRMIIKDADMEILVEDTDVALARVTQLAADSGGYVLETQTSYRGELKHATLRLGVPSAQFEKVLNDLRGLGLRVLRETTSGQDVSAEYVDLKSRLGNLEATAARVREFLNDATKVEDALRVNQELSELEGQIEQIKGQMKYYEG